LFIGLNPCCNNDAAWVLLANLFQNLKYGPAVMNSNINLFDLQDFGDGVACLMKQVQDVSCGQFNCCCYVDSIIHDLRLHIVVLDIDGRRHVDSRCTTPLYQPNFQPNLCDIKTCTSHPISNSYNVPSIVFITNQQVFCKLFNFIFLP
jgi:hypothetical protein